METNVPALITAAFLLLVLGAVLWYAAGSAAESTRSATNRSRPADQGVRLHLQDYSTRATGHADAHLGPDRRRFAARRTDQRADADGFERRPPGDVRGQAGDALGAHRR